MNATSAPKMTVRRTVAAVVLAAGLVLTGCQTAVNSHPDPAPGAPPQAPAGIHINRPADRIAEDIARTAERMRELSRRFKGVPADRVEETLAREAAAAQP